MTSPLDTVSSLKVKLGLLVAASVVTAVLLTLLGSAAHVSPWLVLPVTVALALGVTSADGRVVATLRDGDAPVAGATVTAQLRPEDGSAARARPTTAGFLTLEEMQRVSEALSLTLDL